MNLKVLNTVVWSWSSDETEEERCQEGNLGKQRLCLALSAIRIFLEDSTDTRLWDHDKPDSNLRWKHWCQITGHWRTSSEAGKGCSWQNVARACLSSKPESCAEPITESRKSITSLRDGHHLDFPNAGQQNSRGMGTKLTPLYGMFKLQVENWAPELLTRCFWGWEAANLT